jgi:arginase family enzyme
MSASVLSMPRTTGCFHFSRPAVLGTEHSVTTGSFQEAKFH